jgi:hypothetical protein
VRIDTYMFIASPLPNRDDRMVLRVLGMEMHGS